MSSPRSTAFGACLGTVDNSTVLPAFCGPARPAAASHGTLTFNSVATYPISGASTLANVPFCGQFSWAVVWLTGSSGVAIASRAPSKPATVATTRAILRLSPALVTELGGSSPTKSAEVSVAISRSSLFGPRLPNGQHERAYAFHDETRVGEQGRRQIDGVPANVGLVRVHVLSQPQC